MSPVVVSLVLTKATTTSVTCTEQVLAYCSHALAGGNGAFGLESSRQRCYLNRLPTVFGVLRKGQTVKLILCTVSHNSLYVDSKRIRSIYRL